MSITNESKPSTSVVNSIKVSFGETWATITTTWATEVRTWLDVGSLVINSAKEMTQFLATEALDYLMTEDDNYLVTGSNLIINEAKP